METDVVVVGGGLAGLRAAYEARRAGADVILAVKGKAGRSGSSAMTSAGYSSVINPADSPALHYSDTLRGGRDINDRELVRIFTQDAPERLRDLVELGAPLLHDSAGRLVVHASGDHSIARTMVALNHTGLDFTLPLARAVREAGVRVLEMTTITDVLTDNRTVTGVLALDYDAGERIQIAAPAVILATGGAGRLFSFTSNPNDATGDGYALALRAGAELRDMEFVQFYPWRCIVPFDRNRMPIQPSTFVLGATLRNRRGERFMLDYDRERAESTTRDVAARAIYDQIQAGNDVLGGVRLDLTDLSDEDWRSSNPRPARYFADRNLDFRKATMILAPEAHFFMGGVVVDGNGESRIGGLYAVGEAAGGAHGANRLDSNAIPEGQVFGARAGAHAGGRALLAGRPASPPQDRQPVAGDRNTAEDPSGEAIRRELQVLMGKSFGIVRTGAGLEAGLRGVEALEARALRLPPGDARQQAQSVELANSLLVARACITAGLTRAESRGAHYRTDWPERNDAQWQRALRVELLPEEGLRLSASDLVAA